MSTAAGFSKGSARCPAFARPLHGDIIKGNRLVHNSLHPSMKLPPQRQEMALERSEDRLSHLL